MRKLALAVSITLAITSNLVSAFESTAHRAVETLIQEQGGSIQSAYVIAFVRGNTLLQECQFHPGFSHAIVNMPAQYYFDAGFLIEKMYELPDGMWYTADMLSDEFARDFYKSLDEERRISYCQLLIDQTN